MLRKIIILCLLLTILTPIFLLTQLIDAQPLTIQTRTPDIADAQKTKALFKRTWKALKQNNRTQLTIKTDDLNATVAFIGRGASNLSGQFSLDQQALTGKLALKIPKTPLGQYINFSVKILPSENGLNIESCKIGNLKLPGPLALLAIQQSINLLTDDQLGSQLLQTIEKISFSRDMVFVTFSSGVQFVQLKTRLLDRLKQFQTNRNPEIQIEKIQLYLQHLSTAETFNPREKVSLTRLMVPLFQLAKQRSLTASPIDENQAALYALAIHQGGQQFRKLAKYLLNPENGFSRKKRARFTLANRRDLMQHFLVSAGLKLISDAQIGFAVGEFKELLDANKGGSGFSFIDLAADRCGLRFAESATQSLERAKSFQETVVTIREEKEFFPDFSDLEEGLNQQQFIDSYENIDSQSYQEIVKLIDQRLSDLPLYQ